jgi:hypothetical protein
MRYIKNTDTDVLFEATPILEKEVERRRFTNLILIDDDEIDSSDETTETDSEDVTTNKKRGRKA